MNNSLLAIFSTQIIFGTNSPIVWVLQNELNCHDDDDDNEDDDTFIKVSKLYYRCITTKWGH